MAKTMHYTDDELRAWWKGLSHAERMEIMGRMIEYGHDPSFGQSLMDQYQEDVRPLTPRQIAAIRKWART